MRVAVNVEDHLLLNVRNKSLKQALKTLVATHNKLNELKTFAFDDVHGYVTVDPKLCGNAFRLSATFENVDEEIAREHKGDMNFKQIDNNKFELF
mmetsp:Transcript_35346/g.77239  ORF Transcript_35346/g.77239 Transcript_35346/m.77239 type:complete len:95 (+) Transcript_35346:734-1018(+)